MCSICNSSHHALDRDSVAHLLAGTPIPSERCSALVVRAPCPPARLPLLCSLLIPGSDVWVMACRSCNSVTRRDGAHGAPLAVNGSTRAAAPEPPSLFLRTRDGWIEKIGLAFWFGRDRLENRRSRERAPRFRLSQFSVRSDHRCCSHDGLRLTM